jgi:hypothetical protein
MSKTFSSPQLYEFKHLELRNAFIHDRTLRVKSPDTISQAAQSPGL